METTGLFDSILFAGLTLKDILIYVGGFFAFLFIWSLIRKLFAGETSNKHTQTVQCSDCGWKGPVSRYAGKCPQCSAPLGDQKVKRP